MKVLVTGASGFIGNYVILELLKHGVKITATSRDSGKAKKFDWFDKLEYLEYDLNQKRHDIFNYFGKPDIVIHLAWDNLADYKDKIHIDKNLPLNDFFIKTMTESGLKNLSIIGTCFEYGLKNGCLSEATDAEPVTNYQNQNLNFLKQYQN
jgi:nucleoside-diphosphate-sugar epimerase